MANRKKVWIVDDMYCYRLDNNELNFAITDYQSNTIREATLSKGSVCKLINILTEYLIDVPDHMWGPYNGSNIGYFNVAAVSTRSDCWDECPHGISKENMCNKCD